MFSMFDRFNNFFVSREELWGKSFFRWGFRDDFVSEKTALWVVGIENFVEFNSTIFFLASVLVKALLTSDKDVKSKKQFI